MDCDGDFDLIETGRQDLIKTPELFVRNFELGQLITKYTETTPTYKPEDKEVSYTEEEVKFLLIQFSMDYCDVHPKNVVNWFNREKK